MGRSEARAAGASMTIASDCANLFVIACALKTAKYLNSLALPDHVHAFRPVACPNHEQLPGDRKHNWADK